VSIDLVEETVHSLEEHFWTGDADFYRRNLRPDAIMLFGPPVGVLVGEHIIAAIAAGPRWASVSLDAIKFIRLDASALILAYLARAVRRSEQAVYSAYAASAYVEQDGAWKLAFHQQTSAEGA
jgi:uncharacterized protein DUF4440